MKRLLFLALLASLVLGPQTAAAQEIDLRVNGVGLGSTETEVRRRLGKPRQIEKGDENACGGGFEKTFRYDGLEVVLLSDENGADYDVIGVEVTSAVWVVSGLRIGASLAAVRRRHGGTASTENRDGVERWSYVNKGNDGFGGFYFAGGKLVKISWASNLC